VVDSIQTLTDIQLAEKKLNHEVRIQAIEVVSEALCCIISRQSCMFCIMLRRKMWRPWKELENATEYYPYIYVK